MSDAVAKVADLGTYLEDASNIQKSTGQKQIVPIVVYDLPDRDCAAKASNGEFSIADNGQANYENYIDQIVAQVQSESSCRSFDLEISLTLIVPACRVP